MKTLLKLNLVLVMIMLYMANIYGNTLVLDDFNSGVAQNYFGGVNGAWYNNATIKAYYYADPDKILGRTGYSIKLTYDIGISGDIDYFGGYAMKLNNRNISQYNYLSFWVKGETGNEYFKIELKNNSSDPNRKAGKFYITDYLDGGVTTEWQKVVIPLDTFSLLDSLTNMNEFVIAFENYQTDLSGYLLNGIIYIDDIVFGTWFSGCVRIDHYGDKDTFNVVGGQMGSGGTGSINYSLTNEDYHDFSNCLKIHYDVSGKSNVYIFSFIGGGTNGWEDEQCDFSDYDYFTFWAKSTNGDIFGNGTGDNSTTPWPWRGIKVATDIDDNYLNDEYFLHCPTITNGWQKFSFELDKFRFWDIVPGRYLDKSKIAKFMFVIDGAWLNAEDHVGTLYIDEVQFEVADYTPDTTSPSIPTLLKNGDDVVTNGYAFDVTNTLYVQADTGTSDESLEGVMFEYSLDNGSTWYRIGTDYDTSDVQYSVEWDTTDIENSSECQIQVYSMDASGNVSGKLTYDAVIDKSSASTTLTKPAQKILTPNNDGINDYLNFTGLGSDFEISIFNLKGKVIKRITDKSYWDGKNDKGNIVEGGIYIYIVKCGDDRIDGTIVVVK